MLASDPYLSHMVAATVQTAKVKDIHTGPGGTPSAAPISAAAQPTSTTASLVLVTVMVALLHTVLVHIATR